MMSADGEEKVTFNMRRQPMPREEDQHQFRDYCVILPVSGKDLMQH